MLSSPTESLLQQRHRLSISGAGADTLLFVHGLGWDQDAWRFVAPHFESRARVIGMDLVGFGASPPSAWDEVRYAGLDGHARDVAAVVRTFGRGRCIVVGHSVGAMIGLLADAHAPGAIAAHCMIGPSPCYRNEGDYPGGFAPEVLAQTLDLLDADVQAWTEAMRPLLLAPDLSDQLTRELTHTFGRARPQALIRLARAAFLGDLRDRLGHLAAPVQVVQSDEDRIAPLGVGRFMASALPDGTLAVIRNPGHCPHLTRPEACVEVLHRFLDGLEGRWRTGAVAAAHAPSSPRLPGASTRSGSRAADPARPGLGGIPPPSQGELRP